MIKWVDIKDWEGLYKINETGLVKSLNRMTVSRSVKERILIPHLQNNGYLMVSLWKNNRQKNYLLHRLLGITFISNPNNYKFINHKNGIKTDNRLENLEWCTKSHNCLHAYATGLKKVTDVHLKRLIDWNKTIHTIPIEQYTKNGDFVAEYKSGVEAAAKTGFDYTGILKCVRGNSSTCGGFKWNRKVYPYLM